MLNKRQKAATAAVQPTSKLFWILTDTLRRTTINYKARGKRIPYSTIIGIDNGYPRIFDPVKSQHPAKTRNLVKIHQSFGLKPSRKKNTLGEQVSNLAS